MHLLQASSPAFRLVLLIVVLLSITPYAATAPSQDTQDDATSPTLNHGPPQPSVQPFATQLTTTNNNNSSSSSSSLTITTTPPPQSFIFHLLDLRAIFTSPATAFNVANALERFCEALAWHLLDLDGIMEQNLQLRFGEFVLDFHATTEYLSMLAVKAVVKRLLQLIGKGLLGFLEGEVFDVQANVRMAFTFGVLGGGNYGK